MPPPFGFRAASGGAWMGERAGMERAAAALAAEARAKTAISCTIALVFFAVPAYNKKW